MLGILVAVAIGLVAMLGAYWAYLSYTIDVPYHEMWIGLNSPLPEFLRSWSCHIVHDRIGGGLPPYGCEGLWD
ncbi:hypothetical protein [Pseudorhodobacter sp.]|uniref:hypothetical protein n=1 Tax=Pseudorhodobacter sp. TaxID=1934400 RepID=UPI0026486A3A|nr:hypothetical protein [Pseudorhodobacter sp.]MDN5786375.1 hypothetical protein [Pseudorhodobacter sp.]